MRHLVRSIPERDLPHTLETHVLNGLKGKNSGQTQTIPHPSVPCVSRGSAQLCFVFDLLCMTKAPVCRNNCRPRRALALRSSSGKHSKRVEWSSSNPSAYVNVRVCTRSRHVNTAEQDDEHVTLKRIDLIVLDSIGFCSGESQVFVKVLFRNIFMVLVHCAQRGGCASRVLAGRVSKIPREGSHRVVLFSHETCGRTFFKGGKTDFRAQRYAPGEYCST